MRPLVFGFTHKQKHSIWWVGGSKPHLVSSFCAYKGPFARIEISRISDDIDVLNKNDQRINRQTISQYLYDPSSLYFQGRLDGILRFTFLSLLGITWAC